MKIPGISRNIILLLLLLLNIKYPMLYYLLNLYVFLQFILFTPVFIYYTFSVLYVGTYYAGIYSLLLLFFQTEISKRLNAIIAQILPFLSQEHQQQVATAVDRAKQVTMAELNSIIGVSIIDHV